MSQRTIIEKADVAVSNLVSYGGYLEAEQANAFVQGVMEEETIIKRIRTEPMNSPIKNIDKINLDDDFLRDAPSSGTTLSADERAKIGTDQVVLTSNELIGEMHIPYDVLEDNIERGNLEDTIMGLIIKRTAVSLEKLLIQGDTTSSDKLLKAMNGILALTTTNVVNQAFVSIDKTMFKNGLLSMPNKYLRQLNQMAHFVATNQEIAYRDMLTDRQTAVGDALLTGGGAVYAYGVPVVPVALMPTASGIFTDPKNIIMGIQRKVQVETDKDIRARVLIIVLTLRIAIAIQEEEACVKYTTIATP